MTKFELSIGKIDCGDGGGPGTGAIAVPLVKLLGGGSGEKNGGGNCCGGGGGRRDVVFSMVGKKKRK